MVKKVRYIKYNLIFEVAILNFSPRYEHTPKALNSIKFLKLFIGVK